jgi:hypothetical protein
MIAWGVALDDGALDADGDPGDPDGEPVVAGRIEPVGDAVGAPGDGGVPHAATTTARRSSTARRQRPIRAG